MGVMEVVEGNWASKGEVQAVAMGQIMVRFQSGTRIDKMEPYDSRSGQNGQQIGKSSWSSLYRHQH